MESFFGTEIFSYTTEDAIADGVFVRLSDMPEVGSLPREAGITIPVIVTQGVLEGVMRPPAKAAAQGEDLVGRTWDMVYLLSLRARESRGSMIEYTVSCTTAKGRRNVRLLAVIEALSDGSPVIKILLPEES
jgi:hypothetical protein